MSEADPGAGVWSQCLRLMGAPETEAAKAATVLWQVLSERPQAWRHIPREAGVRLIENLPLEASVTALEAWRMADRAGAERAVRVMSARSVSRTRFYRMGRLAMLRRCLAPVRRHLLQKLGG